VISPLDAEKKGCSRGKAMALHQSTEAPAWYPNSQPRSLSPGARIDFTPEAVQCLAKPQHAGDKSPSLGGSQFLTDRRFNNRN
jgi:hypothetical protein